MMGESGQERAAWPHASCHGALRPVLSDRPQQLEAAQPLNTALLCHQQAAFMLLQ